jgi:poly-beta-1,6-N-acetyl-D-glucosamine synthase
LLVDDASNDGSAQMISDFASGRENTKAFFIKEKDKNQPGKRQALQIATSNATGDILLMTDSDTVVPSHWVDSYNHYFSPNIGMVIGYAREKELGLIARVKKIFSAGMFCSSVGIGYPFSCSGANLAIRRSVFEEIGGYDNLGTFHSGDDKLLLKRVHKIGEKVAYNSEATVYEQPHNYSFTEYWHRELRHFGKFRQSSLHYQFLSLLIVAFFLYFPYWFATGGKILLLPFVLFSLFLFYSFSMFKHKEKFHISDYIFLIIYPYYVIMFSIIGTFWKAKWKA